MSNNQQLNFMDLYIARTITPNDPIKQIFDTIDWQSMAKFTPPRKSKKGRKGYNFISMFKALLLIPLGEATGLNDLHKSLREKPRLAFLCGFSYGETPSASTISDFINLKLIPNDLALKIFHNLVAQLIARAKIKHIEIAIDGTHLSAQPHDQDAQWGFKTQQFSFFGYKVILLVSVKAPLFPVAIEVIPGNESENPQFSKVIDQFKRHHPEVKVKKVFGDAAYDSNENFKTVIKELAAIPYIAINSRGKKNPFITENVYLDEAGHLCCLSGKRLVYWGQEKKRKRVKYRCPIAVEGGDCLFASLCNRSKYGRSFYIGKDSEYRLQGIALNGKKSWKKEYAKKRSRIEAENGILKNNRRMKNFHFRRLAKIRMFVLLCCLGEVARQINKKKTLKVLRRLEVQKVA